MPDGIYAQPWKKFANTWKELGIGNHPSPFMVQAYEKFMLEAIQHSAEPRVLLLGATPELRDMFTKYPELQATILDANEEMIRAMEDLMENNPINEICVVGDWLDADLPLGSYDAIFGDQVNTNVAFSDLNKFYKHIHEFLKPTGSHISRITTRMPETAHHPVEELVEKFSRISLSKESVTEFLNYLMFQSHHNPISTTNHMLASLEPFLDRPNIKEYYAKFEYILPRGKEWNVGRPWTEEKAIIEQYFEIVNYLQDDTFFRDSTNLFVLKPKNKI